MKILICGFGSIGERHASVIKNFDKDIKIDVVTKREIELFEKFEDIEEVKEINSYSIFLISSETVKHYETLKKIDFLVKEKIIVVEKPIFHKFFEFTSANNNKILCAYNLRFHPVIEYLKKNVVKEETISVQISTGQFLPDWRPNRDYRKIYSADKSKGGGVVLDLSHEIDYLFWIFGVPSFTNSISWNSKSLEINSDDFFVAQGLVENKIIFSIFLDYISKISRREIFINTKSMTIKADLISSKIEKKEVNKEIETLTFKTERNTTYQKMWEMILNNNFDQCCTLKEALEVISFIDNELKNCPVF